MSGVVRPPWSVRKLRDPDAEAAFHALGPEVPAGLHSTLTDFVRAWFCDNSYRGAGMLIRDRAKGLCRRTGKKLPLDATKEFLDTLADDQELLLNAVDYALKQPDDMTEVRDLMSALRESRSSLSVGIRGDTACLEYAQPPELSEIVESAGSLTPTAATHLRRAWELCFRREEPDHNAAAAEAVRAVEAASADVVIPDDGKPTMGKIISAMKDNATKWETGLEGVDEPVGTIIAMMELVWSTKGARHGKPGKRRNVEQAECEMVLHTAAVLVHWFTDDDYLWKV